MEDLSAADKIKLLEAVDSSASETMSKLRDAVGAEDRAAAREAQRRKTAGVSGDPQTNGGAAIPGHSCGVSCSILPGNNFMFSGDDRGVILMWDCRGAFSQDAAIFRRPRKRFQFGHVDAITGLAATSDGLMCSASKDALVVVWSWIDGVKLHTLHHHHHVVTGLTLASHHVPYDNPLYHQEGENEADDDVQNDENNNNDETSESKQNKTHHHHQGRKDSSAFSLEGTSNSNTTKKQQQNQNQNQKENNNKPTTERLRRRQSIASSADGLSLFEGAAGGVGREPSQVSAGTIFSQPGMSNYNNNNNNTSSSRSKSATTTMRNRLHSKNNNQGRGGATGGRRASSVASARSHNRNSAAAYQAIKPWVSGVVVNNKRYNEDPHRRSTAKTLLITSSLDETIQCFEINPFGTSHQHQKEKNKNNSSNTADSSSLSPPNRSLTANNSRSNSYMNTVQSGYLPPSMMTGRSLMSGGGGARRISEATPPQLEGHSFAFTTTTTRSRTNSVVAFELI